MLHRMVRHLVLTHFVFLLSYSAKAAAPDYFTVKDQASSLSSEEASLDPVEMVSTLVEDAAKKIDELSLLNWNHHQSPLQDPEIPYSRLQQYGTWIRERGDGTCLNTRGKVLVRSSTVPVRFSHSGCTVLEGQWYDPYSGRQYTSARDIQIDHVVPLKNSYISGAWQWDNQKRCLYANFMANDFHLLAVNGPDNMKKGDRTPEKYMPSNSAYACEYLSIWLKIKLIWNLAMSPSEAQSISKLVQQHHCETEQLEMSSRELAQQRRSILNNSNLCGATP